MLNSKWYPIPEWNWYQISKEGKVRSKTISYATITKKGNRFACNRKGRILKTKTIKRYPVVTLCGPKNKRKQFLVHRLVLLVFKGPPPKGKQCCHNDGNRDNNFLSNLRYDTARNNSRDKFKHGTMLKAETHPMAKLNQNKVAQIRNSFRPVSFFMKKFRVSRSAIHSIRNFKTWKTIP